LYYGLHPSTSLNHLFETCLKLLRIEDSTNVVIVLNMARMKFPIDMVLFHKSFFSRRVQLSFFGPLLWPSLSYSPECQFAVKHGYPIGEVGCSSHLLNRPSLTHCHRCHSDIGNQKSYGVSPQLHHPLPLVSSPCLIYLMILFMTFRLSFAPRESFRHYDCHYICCLFHLGNASPTSRTHFHSHSHWSCSLRSNNVGFIVLLHMLD
jgi:hypothetical protein